jgi:hypothetical protein
MRWYRHILKINEKRIPKKVLNMKMKGKHSTVRQRTRQDNRLVKRDRRPGEEI